MAARLPQIAKPARETRKFRSMRNCTRSPPALPPRLNAALAIFYTRLGCASFPGLAATGNAAPCGDKDELTAIRKKCSKQIGPEYSKVGLTSVPVELDAVIRGAGVEIQSPLVNLQVHRDAV